MALSETDLAAFSSAAALHRQGRVAEARATYARLLRMDPANIDLQNCLGIALCQLGEHAEAVALLTAVLDARPNDATAHNNIAESLRQLGRHDEARAHYLRAIKEDPSRPEYPNNYGELLRILGDFDGAAVQYEKAIAINPDHAAAYANLALCRRDASPSELEQYERLLKRPLPAAAKSQIHFALGGLHDRAGNDEVAFRHFEAGNNLKGAVFNGRAYSAYVQAIIHEFDADFFATRGNEGIDGGRLPVFIVGMPRSGTSLVEQILASHSKVHGGGELPLLPSAVQSIVARWGSYPKGIESLAPPDTRCVAHDLLAKYRAIAPDMERIIDKLPMNFFHVGLIRFLFPEARVIHCRRHPLDVALSCFTTDFSSSLPFSYDLRDIGIYYLGERRLMRHFKALPGADILTVTYETLVADVEAGGRRLLEFCGLGWEPQCARFHENTRPVSTASSWQVRQPLYTNAVGRWRRYALQLQPLRDLIENETGESMDDWA